MEIIYFGNGCPKCKILLTKLEEKDIMYKKSESLQEIIDLGFKSVPVLKVADEYLDFGKAVEYINKI